MKKLVAGRHSKKYIYEQYIIKTISLIRVTNTILQHQIKYCNIKYNTATSNEHNWRLLLPVFTTSCGVKQQHLQWYFDAASSINQSLECWNHDMLRYLPTCSFASVHESSIKLFTAVPKYLWVVLHFIQINIPSLEEAHSGSVPGSIIKNLWLIRLRSLKIHWYITIQHTFSRTVSTNVVQR